MINNIIINDNYNWHRKYSIGIKRWINNFYRMSSHLINRSNHIIGQTTLKELKSFRSPLVQKWSMTLLNHLNRSQSYKVKQKS